MSEDNNNSNTAPNQDIAPSGGGGAGLINTLKTNRKAQYILGGAVLAVIVASFLGGGGGGEIQQRAPATIKVGDTVTLENPNGGNSHLTAVPGLFGAADAEEDKEQSVCMAKGGTRGTVREEQVVPVAGGQLYFVKIEVIDGECKGKTGWTSKINIKGG